MSETNRSPYADDALDVENGTQPEEIQRFVHRRAINPIVIDDKVVWNFNNHEVNMDQLESQVGNFMNDKFLIPHQTSGAWGYMVCLLPLEIREAEILAYDQTRGQYNPYPNFIRHTDGIENARVRQEIAEAIQEKDL